MKLRPSIFFLMLLIVSPAMAQDDRIHIGPRITVVTGGGEPANDMMSVGIQFRYRVSERWLIGAAVDQAEFDFELPWRVVGIEQDTSSLEPIDATVESMIYSAWLERQFSSAGRNRWFVSGGAGYAFPDVEDVTGPTIGGGSFDLTTNAGTELILSAAAGWRFNLGRHAGLEFAVRADHHLSEWEVTDRVSGATGSTSDYTALGAHAGVNLRW